MRDADVQFHEEWLGLAQPIEGLVFSVPALADAQIAPKVRATLTAELDAHLVDTDHGVALRDVRAFFEHFLGYARPGAIIARESLPEALAFYAPEGRQQIRPTFAIARTPTQASKEDDPFAIFDEPIPAEELPLPQGGGRGEGHAGEATNQPPGAGLDLSLPQGGGRGEGHAGEATNQPPGAGLDLPLPQGGGRGEGHAGEATNQPPGAGLDLPLPQGGGRGEGHAGEATHQPPGAGLDLPLPQGGGRGEGHAGEATNQPPGPGPDLPLPQGGGRGEGHAGEAREYLALVWDLSTDTEQAEAIDLDKPETETGPWRYPPTAKLERLLRHTGVPIGFLTNRRELRLVYAPAGESSAHLTFRFDDLRQRAGRPLLAALELLFHATRTYQAGAQYTFEGLLKESRLRQADVTKDLAAQVFEAVEILLEGFEHAASRDTINERPDWLRAALEERDDHLYQGILSVVLRLVFILYAEDQSLVPVHHPTYAEHLSVLGLYAKLADDAGAHPESMHLRFGAYGRLIALFRAIYLGVTHGPADDPEKRLRLPPRSGRLFDPSAYPFLEGGLPGWTAAIALPEERAAVQLPTLDDDTIYRVLHRLVVFEGQRLSYRSLDVEQIGAVYESLMGYHVERVESPAVRLGKARVWVETERVRAMKAPDRKRLFKETCGLSTAAQKKAEQAVKDAGDAPALADLLGELSPRVKKHAGMRDEHRHRVAAGRLVLQPGEERRRTGSHYTPRWLSEKVVQRTLEPILACLGESRTAEQILSLKICDPAMGSGAFLVAACRLLAEEIVAAWERSGERAALTEAHGDALLHARRLVAQRCLYGVDKNAAAVELAKLSLWLVTLSKELPFTFVDHALRHGDSLVGLDLEQIKSGHWEPKKQLDLHRRVLEDALEQALEHRDRILELATKEDAASQREKQRLLEYADQATERVRVIADVVVGAFFAEDKPKAREKERERRVDLVKRWLGGEEELGEELTAMAREIRARTAPFHWMLEFPEVFWEERQDPLDPEAEKRAAYMEAFVGNPPFMGGSSISGTLAREYRDWLLTSYSGAHGNSDLSAYFLRRSAELIAAHGTIGLITTLTICEGDTRATGLQSLVAKGGFTIYDALTRYRWAGAADVIVSIVQLARGTPVAALRHRRLDGRPVAVINSRLRAHPEREDALKLAGNASSSFLGSKIYGQGFTLTPEERDALVERSQKNAERIFPYIGGEQINTSPRHSHERFVITFGQMPLSDAEAWPDLLAIVVDKVKPDRDKLREDTGPGKHGKKYWWQFQHPRQPLYEAITSLDRCLVNSQVSKHLAFTFQPTDRVFGHTLYVYPLPRFTSFAVLQSRTHESWARLMSSVFGSSSIGAVLRYTASDAFETFPFPQPDPRAVIEDLETIGERLYEARANYMVDTDQGLTKTYNALKDPAVTDPRIQELRTLHEQMDQAVLQAYGWPDIQVPPFCPTTEADHQALQQFEDEVIDRLYVLNAERARQEQRLGLGAKKTAKGGVTKKSPTNKRTKTVDKDDQGNLF